MNTRSRHELSKTSFNRVCSLCLGNRELCQILAVVKTTTHLPEPSTSHNLCSTVPSLRRRINLAHSKAASGIRLKCKTTGWWISRSWCSSLFIKEHCQQTRLICSLSRTRNNLSQWLPRQRAAVDSSDLLSELKREANFCSTKVRAWCQQIWSKSSPLRTTITRLISLLSTR